jgi:hypothetical protein
MIADHCAEASHSGSGRDLTLMSISDKLCWKKDLKLKKDDFLLTDKQLERLNTILLKQAEGFRKEGEDPCCDIIVKFEFSLFGKVIFVSYGGGEDILIDDQTIDI